VRAADEQSLARGLAIAEAGDVDRQRLAVRRLLVRMNMGADFGFRRLRCLQEFTCLISKQEVFKRASR